MDKYDEELGSDIEHLDCECGFSGDVVSLIFRRGDEWLIKSPCPACFEIQKTYVEMGMEFV